MKTLFSVIILIIAISVEFYCSKKSEVLEFSVASFGCTDCSPKDSSYSVNNNKYYFVIEKINKAYFANSTVIPIYTANTSFTKSFYTHYNDKIIAVHNLTKIDNHKQVDSIMLIKYDIKINKIIWNVTIPGFSSRPLKVNNDIFLLSNKIDYSHPLRQISSGSPFGDTYYFQNNMQAYKINLDGGNITWKSNDFIMGDYYPNNETPTVDGNNILFNYIDPSKNINHSVVVDRSTGKIISIDK